MTTSETLYRIPLRARSTQRSIVQIAEVDTGVRVGLLFRYSRAQTRWWMSLLDLDLAQYAGPIRCVPGLDLLLPYKYDPRTPQGQLFFYSADRQPPTLETVDSEAVCYYRRPT